MPVRHKNVEDTRQKVLKTFALQYDLDQGGDYARPGNSPPAGAFQVVTTAFDLTVEIARSGFPSQDGRTQRRGGRWLIENVIHRNGPTGVQMLAHALPTLFQKSADMEGAIDGATPPTERHEALLESVADFFPLMPGPKKSLSVCLGEYEALPREDQPGNDPAPADEVRRWARDSFINKATIVACRIILDLDFQKLASKIARLVDRGPGSDDYRQRMLGAWVRGSSSYMDYARLDD